jgi:DNA helicase INO80
MSLSRILNDEPSPALSAPPIPMGLIPIDPLLLESSPTSTACGLPPSRAQPYQYGRPDHHGEPPPPPRGYTYQPAAYQGAGGWDPYTGEWVQGDIFPLGPGGNYYPERDGRRRLVSPQDTRDPASSAYYKDEEMDDGLPRKRRRGEDEDSDYHPPGQKRVSLRKLQI